MEKKKLVIQPAVKKETINVSIYTCIGIFVMLIGFAVVKFTVPKETVLNYNYVDYRVILGGICGGLVAVLNFFLMGLAVQQVASTDDEKIARSIMKRSYSRRMLLQILWLVVAFAAPCFQVVASILPLLFPTLGIKLMGIISFRFKSDRQEVEQKQDGD